MQEEAEMLQAVQGAVQASQRLDPPFGHFPTGQVITQSVVSGFPKSPPVQGDSQSLLPEFPNLPPVQVTSHNLFVEFPNFTPVHVVSQFPVLISPNFPSGHVITQVTPASKNSPGLQTTGPPEQIPPVTV